MVLDLFCVHQMNIPEKRETSRESDGKASYSSRAEVHRRCSQLARPKLLRAQSSAVAISSLLALV